MVLSWPGLQHLHHILRERPLLQEDVVARLVQKASIKPNTARLYIHGAHALKLLTLTSNHLAVQPAPTPEEVLLQSRLIRVFLCWQQLQEIPQDLRLYQDTFHKLGEGRLSLLQTARHLAQRVQLPKLTHPGASLLLAAGQLRTERLEASERPWDALEALAIYSTLLRPDACEDDLSTLFVRDSQFLHHHQQLRMDVVQYLVGSNRRYAALPTPLGFLRGLWLHAGEHQDESFSEIRQNPASFRRVAG